MRCVRRWVLVADRRILLIGLELSERLFTFTHALNGSRPPCVARIETDPTQARWSRYRDVQSAYRAS